MPISCKKCNVSLPDLKEISYRFCPNCGATIFDEENQSTHSLGTIPPDTLPKPKVEVNHEVRRHNSNQQPLDVPEHTLAPDIPKGTHHPPIVPPSTSRPADFFREITNEQPLKSEVKQERRMVKHKAWILLALCAGVGIILVWWLLGI
ncbi:MAG: hypothetical protein PVH56_04570 [Desulfobacterales bacterium]|jgi:predicted  nucleic acid-binding Zn-ribbon protein